MKSENYLHGLDSEEFVTRLAHYWYEVYAVHVFRDGNSRTMRHFFAGPAAAAVCRSRYFDGDLEALRSCLRQTSSSV